MKFKTNALVALVGRAAVALIGATAGCSSATDAPASASAAGESTGSFPRTVTHALGSTEIPAAPKRVVALDTSYSDATLLLETELVGYVTYRSAGLPDYLGESRGEFAPNAVAVGELTTPSLEKIAELQPDLIVSAKVRHGDIYDQLSKIAPTVMSRDHRRRPGRTTSDCIGQALGKEDLAEQKIGAYEDRAAAIGADIKAKADNSHRLHGPLRR